MRGRRIIFYQEYIWRNNKHISQEHCKIVILLRLKCELQIVIHKTQNNQDVKIEFSKLYFTKRSRQFISQRLNNEFISLSGEF